MNKANGTEEAYIYTYDTKGNITGVQLPQGQSSNFSYDTKNNLTKETDFNTNVSTFDYDTKNNQMESIDANVQSVSQRYFSNGNLQYFTHPMSVADNKVLNSSFESDSNADNWTDNWTQKTEAGTTATFAWSTTAKFSNKAISIANPTGLAEVVSDMIPYTSGDKFVISGYVKTASTSNATVLKLEFFDSTDVKLGEKVLYQRSPFCSGSAALHIRAHFNPWLILYLSYYAQSHKEHKIYQNDEGCQS
jgi:YD repeat-containing protein